ncbi:MAG: hypothetical protein VX699_07285 [Myxococcota bacterium]|nr:hypothetical protein [Myxococcota bacterium]
MSISGGPIKPNRGDTALQNYEQPVEGKSSVAEKPVTGGAGVSDDDIATLMARAQQSQEVAGAGQVKDTAEVGKTPEASAEIELQAATNLPPPSAPVVNMTPELAKGEQTFWNNLSPAMDSALTTVGETADGKQTGDGLGELSADALLAEFLKLGILDPNNSVETHNALHEGLSILKQKGIEDAQKKSQEAQELKKEAQDYAKNAQIIGAVVSAVMIALTVVLTVVTLGATAGLVVGACILAGGLIGGITAAANGESGMDVLDGVLMGASIGSAVGGIAAMAAAAATAASTAATTTAKLAAQATEKVAEETAKKVAAEAAKTVAKETAKEVVKSTEKLAQEAAKQAGKSAAHKAAAETAKQAAKQAKDALQLINKGTPEALKAGQKGLEGVSNMCGTLAQTSPDKALAASANTVAQEASKAASNAGTAAAKETAYLTAKEASKKVLEEATKQGEKTVTYADEMVEKTKDALAKAKPGTKAHEAATKSHQAALDAAKEARTGLAQLKTGTPESIKAAEETFKGASKICETAAEPFTKGLRNKFLIGQALLSSSTSVTEGGTTAVAATKAADAQTADLQSKRLRALMEKFQEQIQEEGEIIHMIMESKNKRVEAALKMSQAAHASATKVVSTLRR